MGSGSPRTLDVTNATNANPTLVDVQESSSSSDVDAFYYIYGCCCPYSPCDRGGAAHRVGQGWYQPIHRDFQVRKGARASYPHRALIFSMSCLSCLLRFTRIPLATKYMYSFSTSQGNATFLHARHGSPCSSPNRYVQSIGLPPIEQHQVTTDDGYILTMVKQRGAE